ncbi:MAG: DUF1320 family protein [Verrucomicrobia bacterium]|nr:DUF1320 family protein [Verrucomicrobiota bacterium]
MGFYVIQDDLKGLIPQQDVIEALDDNDDGAADAESWDQVATLVGQEIDTALVSGGYTAPYPEPFPDLIKRAAKLLAVNELWLRRGVKDHPRVAEVLAVRNDLTRLAKGTIKLEVTASNPSSGRAFTEPLKTGTTGRLLI